MFGLKLKPELIFMLPLATFVDAIPIACGLFSIPDFGLGTIVGTVFIDPWLYFRGNKKKPEPSNNGAIGFIKKLMTGNKSKYLVGPIFEAVPYVYILPFWTILVFINLTLEDE